MKILLAAVNAKFIHTNPAIRYLQKYTERELQIPIERVEFTINQQADDILREIYRQSPDILGVSCYLWNYELLRRLVPEIKELLPHCTILLGGPEVSFDAKDALEQTGCDVILTGEGEVSFCEFVRRKLSGEDFRTIPGLVSRIENGILQNPPGPPLHMDALPFLYEGENLPAHQIVYYETSRGCPFSCQYCLSGGEKGVRFRSLERVLAEMDYFLAQKPPQVKLVDRTFNCDKKYAMAIWRHLAERDNGVTNFHFELAAELLDDEMIAFLNSVRPGLFQFEIGVQSTNPETLSAIQRITAPHRLTPVIKGLQRGKNIHLHLDLIAGLPFEGYERFGESFNYVYALNPDQFQLVFLKLLKGSGLRRDRDKYDIHFTHYAPYEVTSTPWISYGELLRLKMAAEMVEIFYNSRRFEAEIDYLLRFFPSPFRFYEALGDFYEEMGYHRLAHSKTDYYTILRAFIRSLNMEDIAHFEWLARFDLCRMEKPKKFPEWMGRGYKEQYRNAIYHFLDQPDHIRSLLPEYQGLDTREIIRSVHIEVFPFDPLTGRTARTAILFNYRAKTASQIEIFSEISLPLDN